MDKVLSLLSLAQRAGGVKSGGFMTENSVKDGSAKLVIIASDASENTRNDFLNMCSYYEVLIRTYADKESLGHAIGKEMRASLAVTNEGLAKEIVKKIDGGL